jgi:hypothetical protein
MYDNWDEDHGDDWSCDYEDSHDSDCDYDEYEDHDDESCGDY